MCNTVKTRTAKSVNLVLLSICFLVFFLKFLVSVTIIGIIGPAAELGVVALLGCSCALRAHNLLDLRGKLHIFVRGRKLRSYESVAKLHRSI
jgi:hypothetical protein